MNAARMGLSFLVIASCCTPACAPAAGQRQFSLPELAVRDVALGELEDGKSIQLEAWVSFAGELKLYDSQEAADMGLVYPYCISASFADYDLNRNPKLRDKRMRVTGTILRRERAESRPDSIQTMAVAGGVIFANSCYGPYLLRIETVEELEASASQTS